MTYICHLCKAAFCMTYISPSHEAVIWPTFTVVKELQRDLGLLVTGFLSHLTLIAVRLTIRTTHRRPAPSMIKVKSTKSKHTTLIHLLRSVLFKRILSFLFSYFIIWTQHVFANLIRYHYIRKELFGLNWHYYVWWNIWPHEWIALNFILQEQKKSSVSYMKEFRFYYKFDVTITNIKQVFKMDVLLNRQTRLLKFKT